MNTMITIRQLYEQASETGGALILPKEGRSPQLQAALNEIRNRRWAGMWDMLSAGEPATALKFPVIADDSFLAALDDSEEISGPPLMCNSEDERDAVLASAKTLLGIIVNKYPQAHLHIDAAGKDAKALALLVRAGRLVATPLLNGKGVYDLRLADEMPDDALEDYIAVSAPDSESVESQNT